MSSKPLVQSFADDINAVIDRYRDQGITIAEVVGAMTIGILEVWDETRNGTDQVPGTFGDDLEDY